MLLKENIAATAMVASAVNARLNTSMERQLSSTISAMDNLKFQFVFLIKQYHDLTSKLFAFFIQY